MKKPKPITLPRPKVEPLKRPEPIEPQYTPEELVAMERGRARLAEVKEH